MSTMIGPDDWVPSIDGWVSLGKYWIRPYSRIKLYYLVDEDRNKTIMYYDKDSFSEFNPFYADNLPCPPAHIITAFKMFCLREKIKV